MTFTYPGFAVVYILYISHITPFVTKYLNGLYQTNALHFSGVTITHLQELKQLTTASGNRYTLLLSVAIVKDMELV
jgi:hypothetical protein